MDLCATTGTSTGEKGCQEYIGQQVHVLGWYSEQDIDIDSLKLKPFMEALIYASSNRMFILKNAEYFEPVAPEQEIHTPENGSEEVLNDGNAKIIFKHKSGNCIRRTFAALKGQVIYVLIGTKRNVISGVRSSYDKLKTAKVRVNIIDEVIDGKREYKQLVLTFEDDIEQWVDVKKDVKVDYRMTDLTPLTGLYIHVVSASAGGNVVLAITDCNDTLYDGLTVGNIGVYNGTDGAAVTMGAFTDNGDGTYTASVTSGLDAGDTCYGTYSGPASDNLYVQVETEQQEATA